MMKAALMRSPGDPSVLQIERVPVPSCEKANQVLVKLKAAGVNPIDTKLRRRGSFYPAEMPCILGCDGAGVVAETGKGVTHFQVGDEVYFCAGGLGATSTGNYAEWAVVPEHQLAPKPQNLSFAMAAAAPLVLITAWEALYDRGYLQGEQTVLIHGGTGGVGHVAIQLAKLEGARVCTTVSSSEKAKLAEMLGADHSIIYSQTDFREATFAWTNGDGVDLALDTVGGPIFNQTSEVTKIYGNLVTLLEPKEAGQLQVARQRNLRVSLELMLTPMLQNLVNSQKHQAQILRQCAKWIDQGKLKIHLGRTFPLAHVAQAHQTLEAGRVIGKLALTID